MDVKKQEMTGEMMDGFVDGHTPQSLLAKLIEGEQMESALYAQIAQAVPSVELGRLIMHKAVHERCQAQHLAMLGQHFGATPCGPAVPYSTCEGKSEEKEKK